MFLRNRRQGSSSNLIFGTLLGVVSGYYLFHDIFGSKGEKLIEYNKKLKAEIDSGKR
jgi:hypothetical protein